jgi:hypothetical protein
MSVDISLPYLDGITDQFFVCQFVYGLALPWPQTLTKIEPKLSFPQESSNLLARKSQREKILRPTMPQDERKYVLVSDLHLVESKVVCF